MTITTTDTVERYVGDGSQTAWPITFPFFKGEDVKACIVNDAGEQVNLTYGVDYTVSKSTSSIGGTLNYALTDGVALTIWLSLAITQPTDFYNTGPLNAEVLEDALDRLTLIAQQLWEASGRSIKVENSSMETSEQLLASLYAGRDAAVASASAAASSESNAAASEQAAATSESNAADSAQAAAGSVITAEAWAESETAPDPNDTESKSAKSWALIASDNVPIATATLAGKAKASASWQVDSETGVATVPTATVELTGIVRQATDAEALAGEDDESYTTPAHLGVLTSRLDDAQATGNLGGSLPILPAGSNLRAIDTTGVWKLAFADYTDGPINPDNPSQVVGDGFIQVIVYGEGGARRIKSTVTDYCGRIWRASLYFTGNDFEQPVWTQWIRGSAVGMPSYTRQIVGYSIGANVQVGPYTHDSVVACKVTVGSAESYTIGTYLGNVGPHIVGWRTDDQGSYTETTSFSFSLPAGYTFSGTSGINEYRVFPCMENFN